MADSQTLNTNLKIETVAITVLNPAPYNPRKWSEKALAELSESIKRFGLVDPLVVNGAAERRNVVIGGHMRLKVAQELGYTEMPVAYVHIPDINREKELNLRLNKAVGEWDWDLLAEFDKSLLADVGFSSEELDNTLEIELDTPEQFNLQRELEKLDIKAVKAKKGDIYQLGDCRLMVGDSTIEADMQKLMNGEKADMCFTDPPYILDYLHAKRHGKPTEGFGSKRNRRYLETDVLPDNFTELQEFIETHHKKIHISEKLRAKVEKHYGVTKTLFEHYKIETKLENPFIEYSRYVLSNGTENERMVFANGIQTKLAIKNGQLSIK